MMSRQISYPGKGVLPEEFCTSSTNSSKDLDDACKEIKNMCSVLNVVIDHTMEPITPLEPEEWKNSKENCDGKDAACVEDNGDRDNHLEVPVIRIFGPLLRDPHSQPLQSACLYIHGAYPYILARPVVAGPDGSIYTTPSTTTHVNWDDPDDVESIQSEIQATLEETLQSSFLDQEMDSKDGADRKRAKSSKRNAPIIRKVTVVMGRGFYTFCPGPYASFLRVGKFQCDSFASGLLRTHTD